MAYGAAQLNVSTQKVITHVITNQTRGQRHGKATNGYKVGHYEF